MSREYSEGEILKSDKSPSQIRNFEISNWTQSNLQLRISDLRCRNRPISKFFPSHRRLVRAGCCCFGQLCDVGGAIAVERGNHLHVELQPLNVVVERLCERSGRRDQDRKSTRLN